MGGRLPQLQFAALLLCVSVASRSGSLYLPTQGGVHWARNKLSGSSISNVREHDLQGSNTQTSLRLRGGKIAESSFVGKVYIPDNLTIEWDGKIENCKCMQGCVCDHCAKRDKLDDLEFNRIPIFDYKPKLDEELWSRKMPASPQDYQDEPEVLNVSTLEELSRAVFENEEREIFPRRQLFFARAHIMWENRTLDEETDNWLGVYNRSLHLEGQWTMEPAAGSTKLRPVLHSFLWGGWALSARTSGSFRRVVCLKDNGGSLIVVGAGNWTFESCRLRVRPGPIKPGRYPGALGWLGGHILFADFFANILVRGCYLGLLSHRIALGHYVGVGGEHHVRARIENSMIDRVLHGVAFGEDAHAEIERCFIRGCRIAVALNDSAVVSVNNSVLGPNALGSFASDHGAVAAKLYVSSCNVSVPVWYNTPRPGVVVGLEPVRSARKGFVPMERNFTMEEFEASYPSYNEELKSTTILHDTLTVLENFNPNLFNNTDMGAIPDQAMEDYDGYPRDV